MEKRGHAAKPSGRLVAGLSFPHDAVRRLLVRAPNWIGDAVMCEPALASLRHLFPAAEITVLAKHAVGELLRAHPGIDATLLYDDRGTHAGWGGKWALAGELRRGRFDLAILFQNAFEAALLVFLAGIPRRYGYATDGRSMLLSRAIPVPQGASTRHHVEYYRDLLRSLGTPSKPRPPRLHLTATEVQEAADRLAGAGIMASDFVIGLNPGSVYGGAKRWLPERFAAVADRLVAQAARQVGRRAAVVIVGGHGEETLGRTIAEGMTSRAVVWSGQTTVRQLMAVVGRCGLFLTNDTGPMHVAAAVGTPVAAIFGPTDWRNTAPCGARHVLVRQPVDCAPCLLRECPIDHRCMTRVTVDQVYHAACRLLDGSSRLSRLSGSKPSEPTNQTNETNETNQTNLFRGVVFLDRDGTINEDTGYVKSPEEFRMFPGTVDAIRRLNQASLRVVVVTNQSGVARGYLAACTLDAIHAKLHALVQAGGAAIDGIYACPHLPEAACPCRKPQAGLVDQAIGDLGLEGLPAYVVGDQRRDMELAERIGARAVLVLTGPGSAEASARLSADRGGPDAVARDLPEAVEFILRDLSERQKTGQSIICDSNQAPL